MSDKIHSVAWGHADGKVLGYDVFFPNGGPVLTLTPEQAEQLRDTLSTAIAVDARPTQEPPHD